MSDPFHKTPGFPVGIIGFGAFGQLIAEHLHTRFPIFVFDTEPDAARAEATGARVVPFNVAAGCPVVVLAVPVAQMRDVVRDLAPLLKPGTLVLDVGSVKVEPAKIMEELLPADVEIVATHPLFGPQSARGGIRGLQIALCPLRGRRYALCIVIGSTAGLVSALMSTSGIPAQIGFVLLAAAWLFTMWKGYRAARTRRFADHRFWMIRNYALTFAAVLLRLFLGLGSIAMAIWPKVTFADIYLASIWGSILVCAVLAEWLFVSPLQKGRA